MSTKLISQNTSTFSESPPPQMCLSCTVVGCSHVGRLSVQEVHSRSKGTGTNTSPRVVQRVWQSRGREFIIIERVRLLWLFLVLQDGCDLVCRSRKTLVSEYVSSFLHTLPYRYYYNPPHTHHHRGSQHLEQTQMMRMRKMTTSCPCEHHTLHVHRPYLIVVCISFSFYWSYFVGGAEIYGHTS